MTNVQLQNRKKVGENTLLMLAQTKRPLKSEFAYIIGMANVNSAYFIFQESYKREEIVTKFNEMFGTKF